MTKCDALSLMILKARGTTMICGIVKNDWKDHGGLEKEINIDHLE